MANQSNGLGELRDVHGRHLNSLNKDYMLPADSAEMKRLSKQHKILSIALGSLYPDHYAESIIHRLAHREGETIRICDLGSGSGDWAAEMAAAFPHSDVLAIDLAPGIPENAPPNVQFKVADVTKEVPEYYDQFDLIQARCVANGIKDFEALVALVHHYLKPGGVFIIAEGRVSVATIDNMILVAYDLGYLEICGEDLEFMIPKESGGLAQLFAEIAKRQPSPNNKGVARVADFLDGWLKEHGGFEEINDRKIYIPLGWEGSTDLCKEPHRAGQLMLENARIFAGAWKPMFLSMGLPESDVDKWVTLAREELENPETTRGYAKFRFVCATKRR